MSFENEINKTAADISAARESGDICFAMLCDTHLSDGAADTYKNIAAVDSMVKFDFAVHLGNVINGDNPEKISSRLLSAELDILRSSVRSGKLFVCRGETDGWRDERFAGQLALNIVTDEMWHKNTSFIDEYAVREGNNPYYYADIQGTDVRLVFLSPYKTEINPELELFEKYERIDVRQQAWLKECALCGCKGKTVLLFSHHIPKSRYSCGSDPYFYEGRATEPALAIIQQAQRGGAQIGAWFGGGYGLDGNITLGGINLSVMDSQIIRGKAERNAGDETADCWDAVLLKPKKRELRLFRFGFGNDRIIKF